MSDRRPHWCKINFSFYLSNMMVWNIVVKHNALMFWDFVLRGFFFFAFCFFP